MTLYRFEDSYGMFDLWCLSRGVDRKSIGVMQSKSVSNYYGGDYVSFGLSNSQVSCMTKREMDILSQNLQSGDCIVVVMDVDDLSGDNQKILSVSDFLYGPKKSGFGAQMLNALAEEYGFSVKFALVSYCAETIALYEHAANGACLTNIVCRDGGKLLHEALNEVFVKEYVECHRESFGKNVKVSRIAKRMHQYVDFGELAQRISTCADPMNMRIARWITDGMRDCTYLLDIKEAVQYLETTGERYYALLNSKNGNFRIGNQSFQCGGRELEDIIQEVKEMRLL